MANTSLSVIIPVYNEERRLGRTLDVVGKYLRMKRWEYEILVVDDGSTDGTLAIAKEKGDRDTRIIRNERNRGKGYSVKNGVMHAKKEWVLFMDADMAVPFDDIEEFMRHADKDIIIGSRGLSSSDVVVHQPFFRELSGKIYNCIVRLIAVRGIRDTQCGMKMFRSTVAKEVFRRQTIERWGFDVELLFIAQKHHYSVIEVPVRWYNDPNTKVRFVRDASRMFTDLLRVRWNDIRGKYA